MQETIEIPIWVYFLVIGCGMFVLIAIYFLIVSPYMKSGKVTWYKEDGVWGFCDCGDDSCRICKPEKEVDDVNN